MKKLLIISLFIFGIFFAVWNFQGLGNKGNFNSIVLNFQDNISMTDISQELETINQKYQQEVTLNSIFSINDHVYIVSGDQKLLNKLRNSALKQKTEYIEPNYIYQTLETPNDPDYSKQWNLRSINIESAWDDSKGEGVTVAVIDTGVTRVPDLKEAKFASGYNFVNDTNNATDDNGHGTHIAGTIAQSTNNNYGVAGIAYKARIMPLKVLAESGGGTVADIAEAIKFAVDNGADVINLSLGGSGESRLLKEAINYAYSKNLVIVAAAGNSNDNASTYPARYPKVISVAALDSGGKKAPYSNFGAGVDISAPGGSENGKILQNTIDYNTKEPIFAEYQGTSMAAPHVAGVAALVKSLGINEPEEITKLLKQASRKITEDPLNHYGAGQLDAAAAVKLALKGQITFKDFFVWLRDNGYLNPRFWIDGGAVALLPKIAMVLGSYLLAWLLRNYFPFRWSWSLSSGLIVGSSGLFFLQTFYIFDLPQWPFRLMGSSIPELGNIIQGTSLLNPIFASVLIPFILIALLTGNYLTKWFAIGSCIGVASCLLVNGIISPHLWLINNEIFTRSFLIFNALLCYGLAYLASQGNKKIA